MSDLGFFAEPGKHSLVSIDYSKVSQDSDFKVTVKSLHYKIRLKDCTMHSTVSVGPSVPSFISPLIPSWLVKQEWASV